MAARSRKEKPAPGPDDLVRIAAGAYRTGDRRFEVQKSDMGWFIVDTEQANEFGQQLIHGPVPTLEAVRLALTGAREIRPLLRGRVPKARTPTAQKASVGRTRATPAPPPPPAPSTWIDRLPDAERSQVQRLIRALDKEGIDDAEDVVRRHRDEDTPLIATRLVEQRLRALVGEQPEADRERAQVLIHRVTEVLTSEGTAVQRPAPGWALVEVKPDDGLRHARIRPRI